MLTRDQILTASDRPTQTVEVPEWGGQVIVCTMDGGLRATYESILHGKDAEHSKDKLRAVIVAICAVDEQGDPLFTPADIDALQAKSGAALDRVFDAAAKLNKLFKTEVDAAEKNSPPTESGSSPSVSPLTSAALCASSTDASTPPN